MAIYRGPGGPGDATADAANTAQLAQEFANNAAASAAAAASSAVSASTSASDAVTAKTAAELAETNAETAETNAELAETNAEAAQIAAEAAQLAAENARDASINLVENLNVTASTEAPGDPATVSWDDNTLTLAFGIPEGLKGDKGDTGDTGDKGDTGDQGPQGVSIVSVDRTSGDGSPGTTDTYTITYSDSTTDTFTVYNGANGTGVGTVTSVDMSVPTGLTVSGNPITTSGTLAVTYDTDYSIPTNTSQSNWDTAYGWGDHALAGYLTTETDPVFTVSPAAGITNTQVSNWDTAYGWGDHATAGYYLASNPAGYTTNTGTVTSVSGTGTVNGITLSGTVTSSGDLTLGGTLSNVSLTTQVTGTLPVANGGTGITSFGTGVATSLGNNTNANGGFVVTDGTATLTNKTLTDPAIIGTILEDVYTISDGAAFEIDPGNGSIQLITLGASRTPKATNFAAGEAITLMVDDGTAYTLTWTDATFGGSGVVWKTDGGVAPTLNTTGYTVIVLWKVGTQVYGARVGDA
jgi:hypothetical protein